MCSLRVGGKILAMARDLPVEGNGTECRLAAATETAKRPECAIFGVRGPGGVKWRAPDGDGRPSRVEVVDQPCMRGTCPCAVGGDPLRGHVRCRQCQRCPPGQGRRPRVGWRPEQAWVRVFGVKRKRPRAHRTVAVITDYFRAASQTAHAFIAPGRARASDGT